MRTVRAWLPGLLAAALAAPCAAAAPAAVRGFLKANCIACHDDGSATAGLSVESLGDDLADPRWVRIHDRVAAGEMPPRDEEQPKPADRKAFTAALGGEIAQALDARHAAEGRVVLRRMNRREYENALHDLLGIAVPLQELLPDDQFVDGFDTATSGLELSPAHLLAYQRAVDAALAAALPPYPLETRTLHWTGRQYLEKRLPVHRPTIDPFVRLDGDALVLHANTNTDATMYSQQPPVPGRYRVRASVHTVNDPGRMQTVLVTRKADRFQKDDFTHLIGYHDVPAGKPTIIEGAGVSGGIWGEPPCPGAAHSGRGGDRRPRSGAVAFAGCHRSGHGLYRRPPPAADARSDGARMKTSKTAHDGGSKAPRESLRGGRECRNLTASISHFSCLLPRLMVS